jgi:hypothetical protein
MQISYENNIDEWIAGQIFGVDSVTPLKKYDKKNFVKLLFYLIILDAFVLFANGVNTFFWFFSFFLIIFVLTCLYHQQPALKQRMLYQRLKAGFEADFEKEKGKTVVWDVSPELIIFRESDKESRFSWNGVRNITICPQYLFIYFGVAGWAWLSKQCVPAGEYDTFCEYLIRTYQAYAAGHEKQAKIIQSDWTIDLAHLKKAPSKPSFKKIIFSILWAIIFLFSGMIFLGIVVGALDVFINLISDSSEYVQIATRTLSIVWLGGSILLMILGGLLGLYKKLPGTK